MADNIMTASPQGKLAKLCGLGPNEWSGLISALFLLPITGLSLKALGYLRTQKLLGTWSRSASEDRVEKGRLKERSAGLAHASEIAAMVSVAARYGPYRASCLRQALVAWALLRRRGIDAQLKIGANKDAAGFSAHAWVTTEKVVLLGGTDAPERYADLGLPPV